MYVTKTCIDGFTCIYCSLNFSITFASFIIFVYGKFRHQNTCSIGVKASLSNHIDGVYTGI